MNTHVLHTEMMQGHVTSERPLGDGNTADWTFVVGRSFLAAVPRATATSVTAALAAQAELESIPLEAVIAVLPLAGAHEVDSFVVIVPGEKIDDDGIPVSLVIRGEIAVDVHSVGGSRRFTDRGIRPWLLADFQSVVRLDILPHPLPAGFDHAKVQTTLTTLGIGTVDGLSLRWTLDPSAPAVRPRAARWGIRLPGGDERPIDAVFRLGRRPRLPAGGGPRTTLIPLASATVAVSGTHLEVRQEGENVLVTDLGSTNGTLLRLPDGETSRLQSGIPRSVGAGTRLDVGDGNIIEILPPSER